MAATAAQLKLSAGKKVTVNGRSWLGVGKVEAIRAIANRGEYVDVQFGDKKTGLVVKSYRPSQLTRA